MPLPRAADDARHSRRMSSGAVAAICGVIVSVLAGCTGAPTEQVTGEPSPTPPTPSSTATPTATAAPAPDRPAAMADPGIDGALATAGYFMDLYTYVGQGDLTEWKALSHPECVFCTGVSDEVERMVSLGHHQEGPTITVNSMEPTEVDPGRIYNIDLDVLQGPHQELDRNGAVVAEGSTPTDYLIYMVVVREGDQWLVRAAQPEPK